ncbi:MAG: hypothetical protein ACR2NW_08610 [Thermodesulfobacteriota bacterium]
MNKLILTVLLLFIGTTFVLSKEECSKEIDVYPKTQTITASLLNYLDDPAKLREITDYYGEQTQIANAFVKEGKYQEACDIYQGVIDKYGFKTIEEQYYEKHPEKRAEHQKAIEKSTNPSAASSSSADASDSTTNEASEVSGASDSE